MKSSALLEHIQTQLNATTLDEVSTDVDGLRFLIGPQRHRRGSRAGNLLAGGSKRSEDHIGCPDEHEIDVELFVYYPDNPSSYLRAVDDASAIAETLHDLPGSHVDVRDCEVDLGSIEQSIDNEIVSQRSITIIYIRS